MIEELLLNNLYKKSTICTNFFYNYFFRSLWWLVSFRWLYNVIRILWVTANNLYVIPAYFAWMVIFSPILLVSPSTFWSIEDVLFGWLLNMVACWNHTGMFLFSSLDSGSEKKSDLCFFEYFLSTSIIRLSNYINFYETRC